MGLLSNKIDRQELKPGDHIYCWRQAFIYAHHGIYVDDRKVIHFTQGPAGQKDGRVIISSSLPAPQFSDVPCPQCGDHYSSFNNGVILSCIDCFLSGGELKLFEYGVSRAYFLADVRGGTCTLATSDPPGDVLHRANILLKYGFGDYDVFKNNCEDFAIYCKTGLLVINPSSTKGGLSGQAASFKAASGWISSSLALFTKFNSVAAAGSGVYYCYSRLNSDIGVRRDVAKVAVERLVPPAPVPVPVPVPILVLVPIPVPVPVPFPFPPALASYNNYLFRLLLLLLMFLLLLLLLATVTISFSLSLFVFYFSLRCTSIDQGIAYVLMLVALFYRLRDCIRAEAWTLEITSIVGGRPSSMLITGYTLATGSELNLFEYGVSWVYFLTKVRGGTCTLATSNPPRDILHRAYFLLKKGFGEYDVLKNNYEDFAIYCKTGLLMIIRSSRGGQSGQAAALEATLGWIFSSLALLTNKFRGLAAVGNGVYYCYSRLTSDIGVRHDVAKAAIEMAFIYAHHWIYVGDGKVIHFTQGPAGQENGSIIISSSLPDPQFSDVPCPQCGDHYSSFHDGVIQSCIDCFLSGGELNLFKYGVSRAYFLAKVRGGTCTLATSDPPGDVLHRANILLENGFGDYDVFKNKCEDFAIYCKTGLLVITPSSTRGGQSGQAASFEATSGLIFSSLALLTYKFKGVAAVGNGVYYCYNRLNSDIGVRRDVAKVAVERLVPPAPAPVSYGTSIDQGIAYVLMLAALVLTYLIHPLDASSS
ncbi:hypothetical protein EZV62_006766 [Acer yangbiense]|uniref:LRAT domain-containing protein n=1 Tax=Acer yangbiense TaxID=1000413 RepID=A0A5C7I8N8_9ROSI|nr:hypothetical protein EZV62_006766 [Acer yangbiense]